MWDVSNIDSVLRIPFDYEALMQESSENESNIVSSHERDTDSNQGDYPNINTVVTSHNTTMGALSMQDHTSQSQSADDALSYQKEAEDTDKSEKDNVISHNELDETNNQDEFNDNDDVDSLELNSKHTIVMEKY